MIASTLNVRPERTKDALGILGFVAFAAVELVVALYTHHSAQSEVVGWALVTLSAVFAFAGLLGPRTVGYLISRKDYGRAVLPALGVFMCLGWSWFQLSGALAAGDAKHRTEAYMATADYQFAQKRLAVAEQTLAELDAEEKAIDVSAIVGKAQASLDADSERRATERESLKNERAKLFRFVSSANPDTDAQAIASAQRRMNGIDAELSALMDAATVAEPFKAAEVEIQARKAGIEARRATAKADRALYLPVVQRAAAPAVRSTENMGLAALILALIVLVGSAFTLPAKTEREERDAYNAHRRRQRAERREQSQQDAVEAGVRSGVVTELWSFLKKPA